MDHGRPKPLREVRETKLPWFPKDGLESGMYEAAARKAMTFSMFLEEMKSLHNGEPSPYYGMSRSEVIEYKNNCKREGRAVPLEALDELLFHAGIKAFGRNTDIVDKFFQYSDTDVIFPEVVANRVYETLLLDALYPKLVSQEIVITDGLEYRKIYISDAERQRQTGIVAKGTELPETRITLADKTIMLKKYGRLIEVAYEDIKYAKLNTFARALDRIAMQIQIDLTDDCILTLVNGDGNTNTTPGTTVQTAATGTIAVVDVIAWATGCPSPYVMTDFVGKKALLQEYFTTLAGMNNPFNTYNLGITLPTAHEWDRSAAIANADNFVGIDKRYAIEHITTGAVFTESDKLIHKQLQRTAISHRSAFTVFDQNAVALFDETH